MLGNPVALKKNKEIGEIKLSLSIKLGYKTMIPPPKFLYFLIFWFPFLFSVKLRQCDFWDTTYMPYFVITLCSCSYTLYSLFSFLLGKQGERLFSNLMIIFLMSFFLSLFTCFTLEFISSPCSNPAPVY